MSLEKTIIEINNSNGAFCFKTFEGLNSRSIAQKFCDKLKQRCETLNAFIVATFEDNP